LGAGTLLCRIIGQLRWDFSLALHAKLLLGANYIQNLKPGKDQKLAALRFG